MPGSSRATERTSKDSLSQAIARKKTAETTCLSVERWASLHHLYCIPVIFPALAIGTPLRSKRGEGKSTPMLSERLPCMENGSGQSSVNVW